MTIGDPLAKAEFIREDELRAGRQTQLWVRFPEFGWRIASAHVFLVAISAGA